jgi:hypothetical protein
LRRSKTGSALKRKRTTSASVLWSHLGPEVTAAFRPQSAEYRTLVDGYPSSRFMSEGTDHVGCQSRLGTRCQLGGSTCR